MDQELAEADVLQAYLPARLTEAEVDALVADEVTAAAQALGSQPTMRQMGQVIKAVNARAQGRADGSAIAAKVKAALA
ncbi:MAG: GatB/YqeY domain-containing protein [Propionibacteriaceae bacterium]|nr:GatB/YqeY domain-containing protein [Propionibacteriaceae bacterium]